MKRISIVRIKPIFQTVTQVSNDDEKSGTIAYVRSTAYATTTAIGCMSRSNNVPIPSRLWSPLTQKKSLSHDELTGRIHNRDCHVMSTKQRSPDNHIMVVEFIANEPLTLTLPCRTRAISNPIEPKNIHKKSNFLQINFMREYVMIK